MHTTGRNKPDVKHSSEGYWQGDYTEIFREGGVGQAVAGAGGRTQTALQAAAVTVSTQRSPRRRGARLVSVGPEGTTWVQMSAAGL